MAMSKLEQIMDIFNAAGKAATPVAIIQDGTTDKERMVVGTVKDILFRAEHAAITNPAIIIVGEVVNVNMKLVKKKVSEIAFSKPVIEETKK
jgi:uroporphyrin-III C-methyltransferase